MKHGYTYPVLLVMLFTIPTAWAGVYKYVDEQGNVTYSQTPPEKGEYEYKKTPKPTSSQPKAKAPSTSQPSARESVQSDAASKEGGERAEQDVAKAQELRKQRCAESQKAVETYTVFRRFKGEDGEVFYMDDNERQQRLDNAKKGVAEFCD